VLFASMASPFVNEENHLADDDEVDRRGCQAKLNKQLSQRLSELLDFSENLLDQLLTRSPSAKLRICRTFDAQLGELNDCLDEEESHPSTILMILQTMCLQYSEVLGSSAECLREISYSALEGQCAAVCQNVSSISAETGTGGVQQGLREQRGTSNSESSRQGEQQQSTTLNQICELEMCVSNCVGSQMSECADSPPASEELRRLSNQLDGLQMLYSMQHLVPNSAELAGILSNIVPSECSSEIGKSIAASRNMENSRVTLSSRGRISLIDVFNARRGAENFARR